MFGKESHVSNEPPQEESEFSDDEDDTTESVRGKVSFFVLHPSNRFRQFWDALQVLLLAYLAFTVPYRVGFKEPSYGIWYILEFFVDIYFWIDLFLEFFTAYWEPGEDEDVRYVTDLGKIRNRYLRTWFIIDFFATLPVEYVARELQGTAACSWNFRVTDPCPPSAFKELSPSLKRFLSVLRLLRMLKLLRIARGGECIPGHGTRGTRVAL